jgi:hypothetical protein
MGKQKVEIRSQLVTALSAIIEKKKLVRVQSELLKKFKVQRKIKGEFKVQVQKSPLGPIIMLFLHMSSMVMVRLNKSAP